MLSSTMKANFWKKVSVSDSDSCWEWTASKTWFGYGQMGVSPTDQRITGLGSVQRAHKISWILHNGRVPVKGEVVRHSCDNSGCVNPGHLILGTQKDNIRDIIKRRRHWSQTNSKACRANLDKARLKIGSDSKKGSRNSQAKLTEVKVAEARKRYAKGEGSYRQLAREYGVTKTAIQLAITDKGWRHV